MNVQCSKFRLMQEIRQVLSSEKLSCHFFCCALCRGFFSYSHSFPTIQSKSILWQVRWKLQVGSNGILIAKGSQLAVITCLQCFPLAQFNLVVSDVTEVYHSELQQQSLFLLLRNKILTAYKWLALQSHSLCQ